MRNPPLRAQEIANQTAGEKHDIRALVFDFDGLILETETPIFISWQELYQQYGHTLSLEVWLQNVGTADETFDPIADLEQKIGRRLHPEDDLERRQLRELDLIEGEPPLPGVVEYLERARQLGLKIGLASSSSCKWVTGHLQRLGLIDYFDVIVAREDVARTKPDPELYRTAVEWLGVLPEQAVAFEDSLHGIQAARQAGLFTVAVPNEITRRLPLDNADLQLFSLADMPLERLLEKLEAM
jgi:HAD superfamily hydrolase (TIGR01509 family)